MSEAEGAHGLLRVADAALTRPQAHHGGRSLEAAQGEDLRVDLCVIGAGPGGTHVAMAAAQLGASVALVEKSQMGGHSLNAGCVPSKALLAAARRAHLMRSSAPFGLTAPAPGVDFDAVKAHVAGVVNAVAPNLSAERLAGYGIHVIRAAARFIGTDRLAAEDTVIRARRFVIAAGSSPCIPAIPGLDAVPFLTSETVFSLRKLPGHLIIIGGGPTGVEFAQAFARLGSRVTLIEHMKVLGKEDPEVSDILLARLQAEGIDIREGAHVERVAGGTSLVDVHVVQNGVASLVQGTDLMVAAGRVPNVEGLDLEAAGIRYDRQGIKVTRGLVTSNRRVFAIGDVIGQEQFAHIAEHHAGLVIRRGLLRLPARVDADIYPWVTHTDPEIAHVGLNEDAARRRYGKVHVYRWPMHDNDRAQAERATEGFAKAVTDRAGRIVGASIVGAQAGELIQMWSLAVSQRMHIKAMAKWISPYPTLTDVNRRVALGYYAAEAANPMLRKLVGWLAKLG